MTTETTTRAALTPPLRDGETYRDRFADVLDQATAEPAPAPTVETPTLPEPYLSKQALAKHYARSVRWVEQRIADGLPVADYMDGRPLLRLAEADAWLREHGHLTAQRPDAPRPGTKAAA